MISSKKCFGHISCDSDLSDQRSAIDGTFKIKSSIYMFTVVHGSFDGVYPKRNKKTKKLGVSLPEQFDTHETAKMKCKWSHVQGGSFKTCSNFKFVPRTRLVVVV